MSARQKRLRAYVGLSRSMDVAGQTNIATPAHGNVETTDHCDEDL
ncbi:MAG TPA: hypothetical protein VNG71_21080 [Pyrinomonadaceae bacterium]|nr:hypothetical protein [Pyrinomonadaceae bacterium]